MTNELLKLCPGCLKTLPASCFWRRKGGNGLRGRCITCSKEAWRLKMNPTGRMRGGQARPAADRLWAMVRKADGDGCWVWTGSTRRGYGRIRIDERRVSAHRFSWELAYGAIPGGQDVLHRCDNPPCVRPDHLFLGTQQANIDDMMAKGRCKRAQGEAASGSKLTSADVVQIRRAAADGVPVARLAIAYDVSGRSIYNIIHRTTWRHVP